MDVKAKIDWVSFTIPVKPMTTKYQDKWLDYAIDTIREHSYVMDILINVFMNKWQNGPKRTGYNRTITSNGITLMFGYNRQDILIEISGTGCDTLRHYKLLDKLLNEITVTRLDIAYDVKCDTRPIYVLNKQIGSNRMKTFSQIKSSTGETAYIGSQKSERYLRIYRFDPPHERSDWLRFEFVLRKQYATHFQDIYNDTHNLMDLVYSLGETFKVKHPAFIEPVNKVEFGGFKGTTSNNNTELWIIKQVVPAFKRLVSNGHIKDPYQWITRHFLDY